MPGTKAGAEKRLMLSRSPTYAAALKAKIQSGAIVERLNKHVLGKEDMTTTQVQAALGLLRKVMADQSESKTEIETGTNLTNILRGLSR